MATYKLKGKVDANGRLVVTEAIDLPPGDVEILLLPSQQAIESSTQSVANLGEYKTQAFRDLWETAQPVSDDFDVDQAKWEALKEKYNL